MIDFHEEWSRYLCKEAQRITRDRFPAAAESFTRKVAYKMLQSALLLAEAECAYAKLDNLPDE
jgi:hypothetical protein